MNEKQARLGAGTKKRTLQYPHKKNDEGQNSEMEIRGLVTNCFLEQDGEGSLG